MKLFKTLAVLVPALALSSAVFAQNQIDPNKVQQTNAERANSEGAVMAPAVMNGVDSIAPTLIEFKSIDYDFGTIKQGDKVRTKYTFTNKGPNPAKLENVKAGCGCTVPKWPQEVIGVGESRDIEVEFNSAGKAGMVSKTVSVTYNGEPKVIVLTFKANIEVPPSPPVDPNTNGGTPANSGH